MVPLITQADRTHKVSGDVLCRLRGDLGMTTRLTVEDR
jgi:hypothetical protein